MKCPKCQKLIPKDFGFCPNCKNSLDNSKKCFKCGKKLRFFSFRTGLDEKGRKLCKDCYETSIKKEKEKNLEITCPRCGVISVFDKKSFPPIVFLVDLDNKRSGLTCPQCKHIIMVLPKYDIVVKGGLGIITKKKGKKEITFIKQPKIKAKLRKKENIPETGKFFVIEPIHKKKRKKR